MRIARHGLLLCVVLWICGECRWSAAQTDLPPKERFHLFLLVGQSNMAGRGQVEPQDLDTHPRVLMFTKEGRWAPAVDPMHFDKPNIAGVGLGRAFGTRIAEEDPEIVVGLIPCAVGGSPIASWEPGGYHAQTESHPYDEALDRARAAQEHGVLKGILWHQGEGDCSPEKACVYEARLRTLIGRFRESLGAERTPFLIGQLGRFKNAPWNDAKKQVDRAHRRIAIELPHCAFVESDGLTDRGDHVHFDARSYRDFGRRYAQAFFELTAPRSSHPTAGQPVSHAIPLGLVYPPLD